MTNIFSKSLVFADNYEASIKMDTWHQNSLRTSIHNLLEDLRKMDNMSQEDREKFIYYLGALCGKIVYDMRNHSEIGIFYDAMHENNNSDRLGGL